VAAEPVINRHLPPAKKTSSSSNAPLEPQREWRRRRLTLSDEQRSNPWQKRLERKLPPPGASLLRACVRGAPSGATLPPIPPERSSSLSSSPLCGSLAHSLTLWELFSGAFSLLLEKERRVLLPPESEDDGGADSIARRKTCKANLQSPSRRMAAYYTTAYVEEMAFPPAGELSHVAKSAVGLGVCGC